MPLATLSIDLVAQLARMEEGLKRAVQINERTAAQIEGRWGAMRSSALAVGGALMGGFSAGAFVAFTQEVIDSIDALNDAKDATGATIENLSALENVARRNGGTLDEVTGILVKFNGVLKEADGKNAASQALRAIGLDAAELRKVDPAQALLEVATALEKYEDNGNKARVVQELFGKSIREAAPFLKDLAEAGQLNAKVTTQQAEQAERFNKNLAELRTTLGDAARSIVSEGVPYLNEFAKALKRSADEGTLLLDTLKLLGTNGFLNAPFKVGPTPARSSEADRLRNMIAGLENVERREPNNEANNRRLRTLRAQLLAAEEAEREIARLRARAAAQTPGTGSDDADRPSLPALTGGKGDKPQPLGAIRDAAGQYKADFLRSEKDAYGRTYQGPADFMGPPVDEAELQRRLDFQSQLNALLSATPSAQIEDLKSLLAALQADTEHDPAQVSEAIKMVNDELDRVQQKGETIGDMLQRNLGSSLKSALQGDFDAIVSSFENMLLEMAAQDIGKLLFGGSGEFSPLGMLIGGLFGSANGNAFNAQGVVPFANGGVVSAATLFGMGDGRTGVMGEAGPEAIVPLKRRSDGKLGIAGGGGNTYNNTYHIGDGVSEARVRAIVQQENRAFEYRLRRQRVEGRT